MTAKRNVYLKMKSLEEARQLFLNHFAWNEILGTEQVNVADAVGRVLAQPVDAALSSPTYHGAAMDGFAVRAEQTYGASDLEPTDLRIGGDAIPVNTGEVLPSGTNAVIMIEHVLELDDGRVRIEAPAYPWQHVRRVGEDIVATEMLFTRNHRVTPYCTGALLAGGVFSVLVKKKPRVLIIPTGDEMIAPDALPLGEIQPGTIIESNSTVLGKLVEDHDGEAVRHERLGDDSERLSRAIRDGMAAGFDMVLVIGGSSAGASDYTKSAIEHLGEVFVHGVTIMPGKPTLLGAVDGRPVVGIPGYPVSAIMAFEEFVAPALAQMLGVKRRQRDKVT
ncbi:MAG: molybdopterin biosynthesis protein, partial [bacterium]|nr:molybdopterin biosynthesis protein [bacterium]